MKIWSYIKNTLGSILIMAAIFSLILMIAIMIWNYWYLWLITMFGYMAGILLIQSK